MNIRAPKNWLFILEYPYPATHTSSDIRLRSSRIPHPASNIQLPASNIQHPTSNIQQTTNNKRLINPLRHKQPVVCDNHKCEGRDPVGQLDASGLVGNDSLDLR